jgi:hypothetical protein
LFKSLINAAFVDIAALMACAVENTISQEPKIILWLMLWYQVAWCVQHLWTMPDGLRLAHSLLQSAQQSARWFFLVSAYSIAMPM